MVALFLLFGFVRGLWDVDSSKYDSVVVIPDLHGDLPNAVRSLHLAFKHVNPRHPFGVDEFMSFIASSLELLPSAPLDRSSRTLLVQLGDLADRGPHTKKLYLLFNHIQDIIGWDCVTVLGNHDLAAHTGLQRYARYVHQEDLESFGGEEARKRAFSSREGSLWSKLIEDRYGIFVRVASTVSRFASSNTLFVHGGVSYQWIQSLSERGYVLPWDGRVDVNDLNAFLWSIIKSRPPEVVSSMLFSPDSPLMMRDFDEEPFDFFAEKKWCETVVEDLLEMFSVSRIIVGHNPQAALVKGSRCEGKILLLDVKVSVFTGGKEGGNPFALVLKLDGDHLVRTVTLSEDREPIIESSLSRYDYEADIHGFHPACTLA